MTCAYTTHKFDPRVAGVYGIVAAILYQYISYRSKEQHGQLGDPWAAISIDSLCEQYPYLGRDQIWRGLNRMVVSTRKVPSLVIRKPCKSTFVYRPVCTEVDGVRLHQFSIEVAERWGLVPAIIYFNVGYWIRQNWINRAEQVVERLDPERFDYDDWKLQKFAYKVARGAAVHYNEIEVWVAKLHPYVPLRSAQRGFATLMKAGLLNRSYTNKQVPIWGLPANELNSWLRNWLKKLGLADSSAKTKWSPPKPNGRRQNQMVAAKTKQNGLVTDSAPRGTENALEAHSTEALIGNSARCARSVPQKQLAYDSAAFGRPSLADARDDQPEGRRSGASRSFEKELAHMGKPSLPTITKKLAVDHIGNPVKRSQQPQSFAPTATGTPARARTWRTRVTAAPELCDYCDSVTR